MNVGGVRPKIDSLAQEKVKRASFFLNGRALSTPKDEDRLPNVGALFLLHNYIQPLQNFLRFRTTWEMKEERKKGEINGPGLPYGDSLSRFVLMRMVTYDVTFPWISCDPHLSTLHLRNVNGHLDTLSES